jgi:hypothetical protein
MSNGLSVSRLVNVSVDLTPKLAQFPNLNTALLLGTSDVIDVVTRMRTYNSIDEVAADFGTSAPEYLAAVLWFEQTPQPTSLNIGRWANAATPGQLFCGPVSAANRLIGPWAAIADGSFTVHPNGGGAKDITGLDFSAQTNLNGVATVINTALATAAAGITVVWNAEFERFEFTSGTTGVGSSVSFLTPEGTGTDISGMLAGLVSSSGAYVANGIAAETAIEAVTLFVNRFGGQFYGLVVLEADDADHLAIATYVEANNPPHFYGVTSSEGGIITPGDTSSIAYELQQLEINHCAVQYSSENPYAVVSLLARILTTNWNANSSTITLMYKQEPGIVAETLNATQMDALLSCNANVFVNYSNDTAIIQPGICPSGQFIDTVIGCDWLRGEIQTNVFNLLYGSTTKIPQTDAGNNQIVAQIVAALVAGVNNGLIAPGTWNAGGFGQLQQGDFLSTGFYVYAPPIASQAESDRQARKSVPFQVAVKLAGAVQTVDVLVNVNQ